MYLEQRIEALEKRIAALEKATQDQSIQVFKFGVKAEPDIDWKAMTEIVKKALREEVRI